MKKLIYFFVLLPFGLAAQINVTDLTKINTISNVSVSQNKVIYTVSSVEKDDEKALEYQYTNKLYLLNDDKLSSTPLTQGKDGASQATLSPNGKMVAFIRRVKDKSQVFILPLTGGEPWQLTRSKYGASSPQFSPDGNKILYSVSISLDELANDSLLNPIKALPDFSLEKPGFDKDNYLLSNKETKANPDGSLDEIRAYLNKNVEDKKTRVFTRLNFQGEADLNGTISVNHLYEIEVKEDAKPKALVSGFTSFSGAQYAADGKSIYASSNANGQKHPDRENENKIVRINLENLAQTVIIQEKETAFRGINISPSGRLIASVKSNTEGLSYGQLCIIQTNGTGYKLIDFDRVPSNFNWSKDEKTLYFTAQSNGGVPVFKLNLATGKVTRLTDFESGISQLNLLDNGDWVYAKTEVADPNELYTSNNDFTKSTRLTDLNYSWLKDRKLSMPEKHIYKNSAGQNIEFWVMKPINFDPNKKYPLLLQLHGGPTAMWGPGEGSMWHEYQFFATQGYVTVYPNQRGSGGYGKDFQLSNYRDWGKGPQEDALGAVDMVTKEKWIDPEKLVITGGSYAGYLTAWIISQDHRFKAAYAQRGVYDLSTFMGEGNAWRLTPMYFGLPWEEESVTKIRANSPFTYVDKITTPFLIQHGDNDLRTGVIQSEMMYKSLKYLDRDVEYVRHKGATHELSRTGNVRQRIDRILRIYEFFERYITH